MMMPLWEHKQEINFTSGLVVRMRYILVIVKE